MFLSQVTCIGIPHLILLSIKDRVHQLIWDVFLSLLSTVLGHIIIWLLLLSKEVELWRLARTCHIMLRLHPLFDESAYILGWSWLLGALFERYWDGQWWTLVLCHYDPSLVLCLLGVLRGQLSRWFTDGILWTCISVLVQIIRICHLSLVHWGDVLCLSVRWYFLDTHSSWCHDATRHYRCLSRSHCLVKVWLVSLVYRT